LFCARCHYLGGKVSKRYKSCTNCSRSEVLFPILNRLFGHICNLIFAEHTQGTMFAPKFKARAPPGSGKFRIWRMRFASRGCAATTSVTNGQHDVFSGPSLMIRWQASWVALSTRFSPSQLSTFRLIHFQIYCSYL